MGYENFGVAQILTGTGDVRAYEKEVDLAAPGNSNWIIVPDKIGRISITVSFTGGATGKIQTTTDLVSVVKDGSPVAVDWPFGEVSTDQSKACRPVTAIRAVQTGAGTMKATIRAQ